MMNLIRITIAAVVLLTIPVETLAAMPSSHGQADASHGAHHRRRHRR